MNAAAAGLGVGVPCEVRMTGRLETAKGPGPPEVPASGCGQPVGPPLQEREADPRVTDSRPGAHAPSPRRGGRCRGTASCGWYPGQRSGQTRAGRRETQQNRRFKARAVGLPRPSPRPGLATGHRDGGWNPGPSPGLQLKEPCQCVSVTCCSLNKEPPQNSAT